MDITLYDHNSLDSEWKAGCADSGCIVSVLARPVPANKANIQKVIVPDLRLYAN